MKYLRTLLNFLEWIWARTTGESTKETDNGPKTLHQGAIDSMNDIPCPKVLSIGGLEISREFSEQSKASRKGGNTPASLTFSKAEHGSMCRSG
jgi:hypothetical protein